MSKIIFFLGICCMALPAIGQTVFLQNVRISFERRTNMWAGLSGRFSEQMKERIPHYRTDNFTFISDGATSLYQPVNANTDQDRGGFFMLPAGQNIVYSDFEEDSYIAKKQVFEATFLIGDSLRDARWKIKNDFREIAGFKCRRATTIIMDSVFVVAFYTDEIIVPGGPESFCGLPGMIMGLVINRVHMSWYAGKVEMDVVDPQMIVPPAAENKVTYTEFYDKVKSVGTWGNNEQRITWMLHL